MNLEKLVSVSGLPGIFKMAANRDNGLIIEDLDSGKKRFVSARKHQFTPLESISIFTDDGDSTELKHVFESMLKHADSTPPVHPNDKPEILHDYMANILPNYDRDKVYTGDIKKLLKWFNFLSARNLLSVSADTTEEEE